MAVREKLYIVSRYSDPKVLLSCWTWKGWTMLRDIIMIKSYGLKGLVLFMLKDIISLFTEVFANSLRMSGLRVRFGTGSTGILINLFTVYTMTLWNTSKSWAAYWLFIKVQFIALYSFVMGKDVNWTGLWQHFWNPHSEYMMYLTLWVTVYGFINVTAMYFFGLKNESSNKKGNSLLFMVFKKRVSKLSEDYYVVLMEPLLVALIGLACYEHDFHLALWLWVAAACLFIQEFADFLYRRTI